MMGSCYFSLVQWQELELQALIFRHMIAGAAVPPELLHLVKKSLVSDSSPYCIFSPPHSYYAQYHSALMQTGYWGRTAMDPEPGRCRRTDGKKWRCSRDVVVGQKYCERHMHRGKNRSRKPVENPTSAAGFFDNSAAEEMAAARQFCLSGPSPPSVDLLQRNQRPMEFMNETKCCPLESLNDGHGSSGGKRTLIPFFDDWPRSIHETATDDAAKMVVSATSLSISIPGNPSSDVSLKLGTCKGNEAGRERPPMSWSTGGPLAEALRSSSTSASTSSPISVLQNRFPRSSVSENSC